MGWTDDMYDDTPDDPWNPGHDEELQHQTDLRQPSHTEEGFNARHNEGLLTDEDYADSDFVVNEDGSIRYKTQTELLMRDYGLYIVIIGGYIALKVI